jgi:hypothetical protein
MAVKAGSMGAVEAEPPDAASIIVNPQGAYLAKRCPEVVQLDHLRPVDPCQRWSS